jgi:hypothetical protein
MDIVTLSLSPAKGKQVRLDDEPAKPEQNIRMHSFVC